MGYGGKGYGACQVLQEGASLRGLPKTGQTISYVSNDDGDYQSGKPDLGDRFTDNGDGTITDNATGLMWIKDVSLLGELWYDGEHPISMTWEDSIVNCEVLDYAGHTDWRLPNIKELQSIVDYEKINPAIDTVIFLNTFDGYWSSTTIKDRTTRAWIVNFEYGNVSREEYKFDPWFVRPVRTIV